MYNNLDFELFIKWPLCACKDCLTQRDLNIGRYGLSGVWMQGYEVDISSYSGSFWINQGPYTCTDFETGLLAGFSALNRHFSCAFGG